MCTCSELTTGRWENWLIGGGCTACGQLEMELARSLSIIQSWLRNNGNSQMAQSYGLEQLRIISLNFASSKYSVFDSLRRRYIQTCNRFFPCMEAAPNRTFPCSWIMVLLRQLSKALDALSWFFMA